MPRTGSAPTDRLSYWAYEFTKGVMFAGATLGLSFRWEGQRHVPLDGPALLIANHQSFLDPLLVGVAASRHLTALARKTLFRNRLFGGFISKMGAVPVDQQGVAKEGLKTIIEELQKGKAVIVYPEGERTWDGKLAPLKPGVHLLIKRAKPPVIPVGIAGAYQALPRTRQTLHAAPLFLPATNSTVALAFGAPLDGARLAEMPREEMLGELHGELRRMIDRAERLRRK